LPGRLVGPKRQRPRRKNRRRRSRQVGAKVAASGRTIPSHAYSLLDTYSLFVRGRLESSNSSFNGGGGFNSQAPEDVLVLTGVTITNHSVVAFVEDTSQGTVRQVKVGDSIAQGKISDINLDELDYQSSDGRKVHVSVGQNLRGQSAFNLIYGTGIGSGSTETDQNVDAGTAALLAKMRAKRLAEMGGGTAATPATQPAQ
jgi:hypothetical protein